MTIVPLWLKLALVAGVVVGILAYAVNFGARQNEQRHQVAAARQAASTGRVRAQTQTSVTRQTDRHAGVRERLNEEVADARSAISAHAGADVVIDADLARLWRERIERVRDPAGPASD